MSCSYIFNLCAFFSFIFLKLNTSKKNNFFKKIISLYFVFFLAGLPMTLMFFFKTNVFLEISKSNNFFVYIVFLIMFMQILYIIFNLDLFSDFNGSKKIKKWFNTLNDQNKHTQVVFYNVILNIIVFYFTILLF